MACREQSASLTDSGCCQLPAGPLSCKSTWGVDVGTWLPHNLLAEARLPSAVSVGLVEEVLILFTFGSRQTDACVPDVGAADVLVLVCLCSVALCVLRNPFCAGSSGSTGSALGAGA